MSDDSTPRTDRPDDAPSCPTDTLFEVLSDEQRRHALDFLAGRTEPVPVDDVVAHVIAQQRPTAAPAEQRSRVATSFHHVHLSKLSAAGMVEYDPARRTVRPTDTAAYAAKVIHAVA